MSGDLEDVERLAASTVEATALLGGVSAVVGQFTAPPPWAESAELVVDWRGESAALPELVAGLNEIADVVFFSAPLRRGRIERKRLYWQRVTERLAMLREAVVGADMCLVTFLGQHGTPPLEQFRTSTDLVLVADRATRAPRRNLEVRVVNWRTDEPVVPTDPAVPPRLDLLQTGRTTGVISGRTGEGIRYRSLDLGTEADVLSVLESHPDIARSLHKDVLDALASPSSLASGSPDHETAADTELATGQPSGVAPRYVNTWFDGEEPVLPLLLGRTVTFCLDIGPRNERDAQSTLLQEPDFGGKESIELLVTLYGDGVTIAEPNHRLWLPRVGIAGPIKTAVTPNRAGDCTIQIVISLAHELAILQALTVRASAKDTEVKV
jgi:hypothetical protein